VAGAAGAVHALLQIIGSVSLVWLCSKLLQCALFPHVQGEVLHMLAVTASAPVLFLWCGLLFGAYLFVSHKSLRLHDQEVFSAQGIEDYKSFLKIRVDAGGVTVFPIGIRSVARRWRAAPGVQVMSGAEKSGVLGLAPCVHTPKGCTRVVDPAEALSPHLIESPFRVAAREKP
jgi:hypothetical protein